MQCTTMHSTFGDHLKSGHQRKQADPEIHNTVAGRWNDHVYLDGAYRGEVSRGTDWAVCLVRS
jgi:hypothetical protein